MILRVSEMFYSLQGEGRTIGVPSVFLRLQGCTLKCSFCDTIEVWQKGKAYVLEDLIREFDARNFTSKLSSGAHLILTGGSPLLQQKALVSFLDKVPCCHVELETEGVIQVPNDLRARIGHCNVSPKLSNSGMKPSRRLNIDVLKDHVCYGEDIFKFPVSQGSDLGEIQHIATEAGIPPFRTYLMPICDTRKTHDEVGPIVAEWAKNLGYNYSPRLHLQLWDKATGV